MVKDGQDKHGLQTTNLKKFNITFSRCENREVDALNTGVLLTQTEPIEQFLTEYRKPKWPL